QDSCRINAAYIKNWLHSVCSAAGSLAIHIRAGTRALALNRFTVPLPGRPERTRHVPRTPFRTLRTALWHLRNGGVAQLSTWRRRRSIAQGTAEPPAEIATGSLSAEVLRSEEHTSELQSRFEI